MKKLLFFSLLMLTLSAHANNPFLTDEEALEEGMTLIDESRDLVKEKSSSKEVSKDVIDEKLQQLLEEHKVVITINKKAKGDGAQTLKMYEDGRLTLEAKVSTGKEERVTSASGRTYISTTPLGFYRPTQIFTDYFSNTWKAPMPNPVFYIGGIAIHATGEGNYKFLGSRASGGCVRVTLENSKKIREAVMNSGKGLLQGQFKLVPAGYKRTQVIGNSITLPSVHRASGNLLTNNVQSWDTIIWVHE